MHVPRTVLPILVAVALAACQPGPRARDADRAAAPGAAGTAATAAQTTIRGTATYREMIKMRPGASLGVQLIDSTLADTPPTVIAQTTVAGIDHGSPIAFTLPYDPARLRADREYRLRASLHGADGELMFDTPVPVPVMPGDPQPVEVPMRMAGSDAPEGAPATSTSPWDEARTRGVAFRGVGNEPGWFVEVDEGASPALRATLDYGDRRLEVPQAQSQEDMLGYTGKTADGVMVVLRIRRASCSDGMSDTVYPATADLSVGTATYRGCGRFLAE